MAYFKCHFLTKALISPLGYKLPSLKEGIFCAFLWYWFFFRYCIAVIWASLSSHTSLAPHLLDSQNLEITSTSISFPALQLPAPCWVESDLNSSISSKNDGISDSNKHDYQTKVFKNPRRNYTKQDAGTNHRLYVESLWPLGLFISSHFHHMDFILLELQKTQTKSHSLPAAALPSLWFSYDINKRFGRYGLC